MGGRRRNNFDDGDASLSLSSSFSSIVLVVPFVREKMADSTWLGGEKTIVLSVAQLRSALWCFSSFLSFQKKKGGGTNGCIRVLFISHAQIESEKGEK